MGQGFRVLRYCICHLVFSSQTLLFMDENLSDELEKQKKSLGLIGYECSNLCMVIFTTTTPCR